MDKTTADNPDRAAGQSAGRNMEMRRWRELDAEAARFAASLAIVPPFAPGQLMELAETLAQSIRVGDPTGKMLLAIMIHNAAWRPTVARVPFNRRLLLLPQCLRTRQNCPGEFDEFGLLCRECGQCPLGALQHEADALGYATLIAEGTAAVSGLVRAGKAEAVIGAGCLSTLQETFAQVADQAVPALAVPLLNNGCDNTSLDVNMIADMIRLSMHPAMPAKASMDEARVVVRGWFEPDALSEILQPAEGHATELAVQWLGRSGKRWRPLLAAAVHDALQNSNGFADNALIRAVAVATECFHKASLVHDDIEDDDDLRYGMATLHREHGVPIALNVGDLLLGEGYALLARCAADESQRLRMLTVVADAHRRLCIGQGEELHWIRHPDLLESARLIDIFRGKTAPAFEVALLLGAIAGGADDAVCTALKQFSQALGIAYQIRDDLLDINEDTDWRQTCIRQPSIVLALLCDRGSDGERRLIHDLLTGHELPGKASADLRAMIGNRHVVQAAQEMLRDYRTRALLSLNPIRSVRLKCILTRLVTRILPDDTV